MTKVNVHEAKTNFSKYLRKVASGEEVVICKNGEPIAQIIPFPKDKEKKRLLGTAKGMITILPSFFDPLTEEEFPGVGLDE